MASIRPVRRQSGGSGFFLLLSHIISIFWNNFIWMWWHGDSAFFNLYFDPQVQVVVDGGKKVVEFSFQGLLKNQPRYSFKSRDLHALFDRQWHKLSISVQSNIVSIYMDCKLIERRLTDERDSIDPSGRTLITTRVEDGRPVDVRPKQLLLSLVFYSLIELHFVIWHFTSFGTIVLLFVPTFDQKHIIFRNLWNALLMRSEILEGHICNCICNTSIVSCLCYSRLKHIL